MVRKYFVIFLDDMHYGCFSLGCFFANYMLIEKFQQNHLVFQYHILYTLLLHRLVNDFTDCKSNY